MYTLSDKIMHFGQIKLTTHLNLEFLKAKFKLIYYTILIFIFVASVLSNNFFLQFKE